MLSSQVLIGALVLKHKSPECLKFIDKYGIDVDKVVYVFGIIKQKDSCPSLPHRIAIGNACYILKKLNLGKIYSIEHDETFFNKTKKLLEINNLEDICKLILSPLEKIIINNKSYLCYKLDFIKLIEEIDILLVDGPPVYIQEQSRFPALLILKDKLNQNTAIYLDDGKRENEKKIIKLWQELFSDYKYQFINKIKGAWKISK